MDYFLFTYPNCSRCEKLKQSLSATPLGWKEFDLVRKESKMKIRHYLPHIKRDEKGGIIIPTLIAEEDGAVRAVLNSQEDLNDWLKSKD